MSALPALQARQTVSRTAKPIRLLIVDDSSVARAVLARMIGQHPDLQVVATAGSVAEAVDVLRTVRVDIVLLDVEMPGGNGVEELPRIVAAGDGARVLIVSAIAEAGAAITIEALASGAADTLPKPGAGLFGGRFSDVLAERVRRIGRAERPTRASVGAPRTIPDPQEWQPTCIAIGASTGGIHAINEFLEALGPAPDLPILITQHLPPLFVPHFARQLQASAGRPAAVAQTGDEIRPGHLYLAPGNAHLCVERSGSAVRVRLDFRPASSGCLPSVDPMLASVAQAYGRGGVAVVLSGMGRDGASGSARVVASGGAVLVQDEASSAVWGMPRAVAEAGLASAILAPRDLARRIAERAGDGSWK